VVSRIPKTIKKRAEFVRVGKVGVAARTRTVVAVCCGNDRGGALAGFTASKKVGRAVKRNKAKRRLRSLVREFCQMFCQDSSYVFIATQATALCDFSILRSDFLYCMKRHLKSDRAARAKTVLPL
jgi:ribonuclease P protein component